jgi:hypothetical protein
MLKHTCNPSVLDAEIRGIEVQAQPRQEIRKNLPQHMPDEAGYGYYVTPSMQTCK